MTEHFTTVQRTRFRKLLVLAAESPYPGERQAALAAAERLAARFGMSVEEAAGRCREPRATAHANGAARRWAGPSAAARGWGPEARGAYVYEAAASRTRQREREAAERAEREEGERAREERSWRGHWSRRSRRRLPPREFARILLLETGFPLSEISRMTGLSMHDLIGLKLKLRPVPG